MPSALVICRVTLLLATAAHAKRSAGTQQNRVTPVQKVIQLLGGMKEKGLAEKQAEEKEFAKFQAWCENVKESRTKSIKEGGEQIMQLEADIQKAKSDAETLAAEVADLEAAIAKAQTDSQSATSVRKKEKEDYLAGHADLSESIDAIGRALQVLQAKSGDVPQSLMQVRNSKLVPDQAKAVLTSFLAMHESGLQPGVPEANAYEFQSGSVVSMLEKLAKDFSAQRLSLEKEEMSAKANYQQLMQQLTDNIQEDTKSVSAKTKAKAGRLEDAAQGEADLQSTKATKAEDEKVLSETLAECKLRSEEFEKNQVLRSEEVKAIEKAMEILSGDKVSGNADKYLPSLMQVRHARALAQMQSSSQWDEVVRRKAVDLLQARSQQLGSKYLAVVAARAAADPFGKVKKMIKELIFKLQEEANNEADEHAFCETELGTNKKTRENKGAEVDELSAELDQLTSDISTLSTEIQELSDAIAEIQGQRAEATQNRKEEKDTNMQTIADAKEAQSAVQRATNVLRDFYNKDSGSFLQGNQASTLDSEMSEASTAPYEVQESSSAGVLGMLEVILSDFARLETETNTAEEAASSEHSKFMAESEESLAVKEKAVEHKTNKRQLAEEKQRSTKKELELTHEELNKALTYYDKLRAQCVDSGLSYDERVKAREQEIQSLKEAMEILDQEDLS